jgi:YHYH protein
MKGSLTARGVGCMIRIVLVAASVTGCGSDAAGLTSSVSAQALPVGDGKVTGYPAVGNIYACTTAFRGGGAQHTGPWVHGDTWEPTVKPHVAGTVFWPDAAFTLTLTTSGQVFEGNGLPVGQPTGTFPIATTDPAYEYDTNPNSIAAQALAFAIPVDPQVAAEPGCLPMGMIGFTVTGVALYNALDDAGRDAAAHEIQDLCDGHPQARSQYHYHSGSPCIPGAETSELVGWSLDGFPILGMKAAGGAWLADSDLDACHGRAESLTIDERTYCYAYHLTREYPYTLGCFKGQPLASTLEDIRNGLQPARQRARLRGVGGVH